MKQKQNGSSDVENTQFQDWRESGREEVWQRLQAHERALLQRLGKRFGTVFVSGSVKTESPDNLC